jgi:transcriptional regulator with XRE-family HTH domain
MVSRIAKTSQTVLISGHDSARRADVNPPTFGRRLRQERDRLELSQAELAAHGGVARTTQHIYDSDPRAPDVTYLERIRSAGVDVAFLILGERHAADRPDMLSISYSGLSNVYRVVDEFCVDDDGKPLPLESRLRFFQLVCASLKDRGSSDVELESLRSELARFTGT